MNIEDRNHTSETTTTLITTSTNVPIEEATAALQNCTLATAGAPDESTYQPPTSLPDESEDSLSLPPPPSDFLSTPNDTQEIIRDTWKILQALEQNNQHLAIRNTFYRDLQTTLNQITSYLDRLEHRLDDLSNLLLYRTEDWRREAQTVPYQMDTYPSPYDGY